MSRVQQFGEPTFESDAWGILPLDRATAMAAEEIEGAQEYLTFEAAKEDMDRRVYRGRAKTTFTDDMSSKAQAFADPSGLDQDFYN